MSGQVEDKKGNVIEEGDTVFTKIRGGKREGEVTIPLNISFSILKLPGRRNNYNGERSREERC